MPGYCWQFIAAGASFPVETAVRAGRDADGSPIFVGRAFHEGDMIPAKVIPDKSIAYVAYGGEEHPKEEYEVLRTGDFVWEFAMNGEVPEGAVEVGQTVDGEKLYMGRCIYNGTQTPGKLQASHGCLYIPFDGEEVSVTEYEVLVIK
ncbi:natterin-3 isoform X2 [Phlebotomus argentipes]|uniref:natterin-3 isoform X2 n=1 Tax=Phlebotomus argentipes TaxID=94469 RepID=UPI002892EB5B|nr:natterin-3 isoform X2 [Phlebotomus argentipes]